MRYEHIVIEYMIQSMSSGYVVASVNGRELESVVARDETSLIDKMLGAPSSKEKKKYYRHALWEFLNERGAEG